MRRSRKVRGGFLYLRTRPVGRGLLAGIGVARRDAPSIQAFSVRTRVAPRVHVEPGKFILIPYGQF
jgi:hypothetical protein